MLTRLKPALWLLALPFSGTVLAQGHGHGAGGGMQGIERGGSAGVERREARPPEDPSLFRAEVQDIDRASATVTLKHEPISVLDVPAGTRPYRVKDAAILDRLNIGDRVRFTAVLQGRVLLVTNIVPAK